MKLAAVSVFATTDGEVELANDGCAHQIVQTQANVSTVCAFVLTDSTIPKRVLKKRTAAHARINAQTTANATKIHVDAYARHGSLATIAPLKSAPVVAPAMARAFKEYALATRVGRRMRATSVPAPTRALDTGRASQGTASAKAATRAFPATRYISAHKTRTPLARGTARVRTKRATQLAYAIEDGPGLFAQTPPAQSRGRPARTIAAGTAPAFQMRTSAIIRASATLAGRVQTAHCRPARQCATCAALG